MSPLRFAVPVTLCGTVVLAGAAGVLGFALHGIENTGAPIEGNRATLVVEGAQPIHAARFIATIEEAVSFTNSVTVGDRDSVPRPETPSFQLASLSTPDPVPGPAKPVVRSAEILDECLATQACIDQYLFSVYERAKKVDTNKVRERKKVTIRKGDKTRTVTKTFVKLVDQDFTWKDPMAAERAGMSLQDYVIGGMDQRFKLRLYRALRAMDDAGLEPGITSAFRDDYRQSIATGNKASSDSSYHGGSRRGG